MSNEAAERLLLKWLNDVTYALDAERKATVERIRLGVDHMLDIGAIGEIEREAVLAILDAEAGR